MIALATEGMLYCYAVALSLVREWVKVDENEMMTGRSAEIAINVRWPPNVKLWQELRCTNNNAILTPGELKDFLIAVFVLIKHQVISQAYYYKGYSESKVQIVIAYRIVCKYQKSHVHRLQHALRVKPR